MTVWSGIVARRVDTAAFHSDAHTPLPQGRHGNAHMHIWSNAEPGDNNDLATGQIMEHIVSHFIFIQTIIPRH